MLSNKKPGSPQRNSSQRENGKVGAQQHNKDRLGSKSGPMGKEDQRKDQFGSRQNETAQGLKSDETAEVRVEMGVAREHLQGRKRNGSR